MSNNDEMINEEERKDHQKLKSALNPIINRRVSALNTYKFDQIIEQDEEEDDESSLDKFNMMNARRNST